MLRTSPTTRVLFLLLCGLVVGIHARPSHALSTHHTHKKAKEQIQDMEEKWRTATLAGDAVSLDGMLSDDYVGISWNGQVNTKATQLDRIRSKFLAVTQLQISDIRIKLLGEVAIVTAQADVTGMNGSSPMEGIFRYTRVYQHRPSGWKITNFEATRVPLSGRTHQTISSAQK